MSDKINGIVVVRFEKNGDIGYDVFGGGDIRLFIIDERCPSDRVYEWLGRSRPERFRELIPHGEPIGSSSDARHPAIKAGVENLLRGEPFRNFTVVDGDEK